MNIKFYINIDDVKSTGSQQKLINKFYNYCYINIDNINRYLTMITDDKSKDYFIIIFKINDFEKFELLLNNLPDYIKKYEVIK